MWLYGYWVNNEKSFARMPWQTWYRQTRWTLSYRRCMELLIENKNYVYRCDCVEFVCSYGDQKNVA